MAHYRGTARSLVRRGGLAASLILAGTATGAGYALLRTPEYAATAHVIVVDDAGAGPAGVNFAQAYGRLATLPETLRWSERPWPGERAGGGVPAAAQGKLRASTSPDAPLIRITGTDPSPERAAAYANAAADALVRFGEVRRRETGVRPTLMNDAAPPLVPAAPRGPLDVAVGTAVGVLLAGLVSLAGLRPSRRRRPAPAAPLSREPVWP
ncbi:YveK family protein [Actinomadura rubteroloni]|uniref:lipopolysaccharide biosynthesis protein n=1 Tax=Actinomadura rubteroloni TaxID=1926885 RepID=UPI000CD80381|nr:lipopolysaccharide biosynthesis protein [Actinomadura rubteroloni]